MTRRFETSFLTVHGFALAAFVVASFLSLCVPRPAPEQIVRAASASGQMVAHAATVPAPVRCD